MKVDKERGFKDLYPVDKALKILLDNVKPIDTEVIEASRARGRIPTSNIVSKVDVPSFNRAAMDGYAVRSSDVTGASELNPIRLEIIGEAKTAQPYEGEVGPGQAVRIDTGAPMPRGADAVVMVEYTIRRNDYVEIYAPVSPMQNVSVKGEDVKAGDVIVYGGIPLTSMDVAALVSTGIKEIEVYKKVKVSIASIGNELREPGAELEPGFIWETNRVMVLGMLDWLPIEIVRSEILSDYPDDIKRYVEAASKDSDVIITTGGTSLGLGDTVTDIISDLGDVKVHGVALQPSKPVLIAFINSKPYIGLPGYPVAAAISTEVFIIPLIMKLSGVKGKFMPAIVKARLLRRVASRLGTKHFVRVKLYKDGDDLVARPIWVSGAGVLSSLSLGDGYLIIPEDVEGYEEGELVEIVLYRRVVRIEENI